MLCASIKHPNKMLNSIIFHKWIFVFPCQNEKYHKMKSKKMCQLAAIVFNCCVYLRNNISTFLNSIQLAEAEATLIDWHSIAMSWRIENWSEISAKQSWKWRKQTHKSHTQTFILININWHLFALTRVCWQPGGWWSTVVTVLNTVGEGATHKLLTWHTIQKVNKSDGHDFLLRRKDKQNSKHDLMNSVRLHWKTLDKIFMCVFT